VPDLLDPRPDLLPLYDSGEAAGFLYYVAPYVEGGSLLDRIRVNARRVVLWSAAIAEYELLLLVLHLGR
jgi:serine/threonine protein kinase